MKKFLIPFITKHLFKWVTKDDLFVPIEAKGRIIGISHKGQSLNPEQLLKISEQAVNLRDSYLWKVLGDEISYISQLTFLKATNYEETLSARLLLRARNILDDKLKELESINKIATLEE